MKTIVTIKCSVVLVLLSFLKPADMCCGGKPPPHTTKRPAPRPTTPRPTTTPLPPPTLPWNPDIPPVINPNADDKPVKFTASIATPNNDAFCSATIISLHFVVTSCLRCLVQRSGRPVAPGSIRVIIPEILIDSYGVGLEIYEVQRVANHPQCVVDGEFYRLKNDIGVVQTIDRIIFGPTRQVARIPNEKGFQPNQNRNWIISSFRIKNTVATSLREAIWFVKVRYASSIKCAEVLNSSEYDMENNICTPYQHIGGQDNCLDDFGASLSMYDNLLIGILIHKYDCGRPGSVASFVDVAGNRDWLRYIVQKLSNHAESV